MRVFLQKELRRIISKHVSKLDDFGDMQLFPDKTIYSCIITLLKKIPFVELDFDDEKQKALYESVLTSTKKINELNIVLEQKKDKASISVIEAEKENLSKQIEDNITKIYNLQF